MVKKHRMHANFLSVGDAAKKDNEIKQAKVIRRNFLLEVISEIRW